MASDLAVVLATSNPGKVREIREILARSPIEPVTVPMWLGDVETGTSYLENARLKAAAAMRMTREPVLAEDAGLEVDALGGLPGLYSARFGGSGSGMDKVLRLMDDVADAGRTARFRAVTVLLLPSGRELVGEGTVDGMIARAGRGTGGFGYDPIFVPSGGTRTVAELPPTEKNAVSHRGRALADLLARLRDTGVS